MIVQYLVSLVYVLTNAGLQHGAHQHRVRLVTHTENVIGANVAARLRCRLQVVECRTQITLCCEHYSIHTLLCV